AAHDGATRLPWYGTEMSLSSAVTARLIETWAHGQDIADALGVVRTPTARLQLPAARAAGAGGGRRGRAVRSGRCTVDLGVRSRRPAGGRDGAGLLPA